MQKITVITPVEYEGVILDVLEKSRSVQLKDVEIPLTSLGEQSIDFSGLYGKIHSLYDQTHKYLDNRDFELDKNTVDRFIDDPEEETASLTTKISEILSQLKQLDNSKTLEADLISKEFQDEKDKSNEAYENVCDAAKKTFLKLNFIRTLNTEEFEKALSIGVINKESLEEFIEYLGLYPDISYKLLELTPETDIIFTFGTRDREKWCEDLFLVFEVKDILGFLNINDRSLILDPDNREKTIKNLQLELEKIYQEIIPKDTKSDSTLAFSDLGIDKGLQKLDEEHNKNLGLLQTKHESRVNELKINYEQKTDELKEQLRGSTNNLATLDRILNLMSNESLPILRNSVISVLQGWVPKNKIGVLTNDLEKIKAEYEILFTIEYEEPMKDDAPPSNPSVPSIFKPFYVLTSMLGTPNAKEFNPTILFTISWVIMFGFMFPDIGQGIIITLLGFFLVYKVKGRRMGLNMLKVGQLFIALGVSSAIFGALFGEFFLIEIHPLLFRPIRNLWTMIKISFYIGILQISIAFVLGVINRFITGDRFGALLGEKGLGGLLVYTGLIQVIFNFWRNRGLGGLSLLHFAPLLIGAIMILFEPLIHAKFHRPIREPIGISITVEEASEDEGMDVMGVLLEGLGAVIESIISLLSNSVSFARLAGFTLAHVALAEVVLALGEKSAALGIFSLVFMNSLALSLEFMVVIVQSLRLLYYEFSTKFYLGDGTLFRPLRIPRRGA